MAKRMGRPSLLSDEVETLIVAELKDGSSTEDAGALCGINVDTVRHWVREGVRAQRALDEDGTAIPDNRVAMVQFSAAVKLAKAEARKHARSHIKRAMPTQWQAAAWFLERSAPEQYGKQTKTEISGPDQGPIQVEAKGSLGDAIDAAIAATSEIVVDGDGEE